MVESPEAVALVVEDGAQVLDATGFLGPRSQCMLGVLIVF